MKLWLITLVFLLIPFSACGDPCKDPPKQKAKDWTLVVIPDTQHYTANWSKAPFSHMLKSFDWIKANKERLNIQMVQGLGDITENWNSHTEWNRGTEAWYKLDGTVAWMPVVGNHDDPASFNRYFPISYWEKSHGELWGGAGKTGNQNNYIKINMGAETYIFLQLEAYTQYNKYQPEGIKFGNEIASKYHDKKIILATHDNWDTRNIRNELLSKHDNIVLSNSGHTCAREQHFTTKGPNGGITQNFIADYQCDNKEVMMLRYYTFKPDEDKVYYYTYSPVTGKFETDSNSQGSFHLEQKD